MKPMILKHAMYFGLLFGLRFSLNFYFSTIEAVIPNVLSWVLVLLMPYVAYRLAVDCRERVCDGVISYGTALWYGIQLFFYAALVAAVFKLIYFNYISQKTLSSCYSCTYFPSSFNKLHKKFNSKISSCFY